MLSFFFSSRRRHTRWPRDWSSDVCSSDLVEWTILRCSWFMQNFSEHFLLEPVLEGVIALPAGDVAEPFLDIDDLADVAVAALTESGHAGHIYELTGPGLLTFAEAAAELSAATGREVRYLPVTPEEYAAGAAEAGIPVEEIEPLTDLFVRVLDGHNAHLSGDVERVLGRPARDFTDYARGAAAAGGVEHRRHAMTDTYTRTLAITAAIGAGLSAGVYFAFST